VAATLAMFSKGDSGGYVVKGTRGIVNGGNGILVSLPLPRVAIFTYSPPMTYDSCVLRALPSVVGGLVVLTALSSAPIASTAAETTPTKSALEADPAGWTDIMPAPDLKGWVRVPVPPTGKLGRAQWHVEAEKKVLICDGDGGHDMLLTEKDYGDAIFHFEFCYTKMEGKKGYNSGAYARNSKDGAIWHQAQFGDAKDGYLFGETLNAAGKKQFFNLAKLVKENRVKPAGEWNTMELTAKGRTLTLWVNGAVTCQFDNCGLDKGRLGVEGEFYRIEFRNLKVKELTAGELK
jgi:hypothetical protein